MVMYANEDKKINYNINNIELMPSTFADNNSLLPSDLIDFAMLPAQRLGGKTFLNKIMGFPSNQ